MRRLALAGLVFLLACEAHRILLVFPMPSSSHAILGQGFVRHLLAAGHYARVAGQGSIGADLPSWELEALVALFAQVTYITSAPVMDPPENLREIDVSSNNLYSQANFVDELLDLSKLMNKEIPQFVAGKILEVVVVMNNATVFHENVQRLIMDPAEEFDLVIVDWTFTELYCGLSTVFNCPLIWVSSMEVHGLALSVLGEDPNPAYVISFSSKTAPPFNFVQRVKGLWTSLVIRYHKLLASVKEAPIYEAAFSKAAALRGRQLPSYFEAQYNGSLMFGNSHASVGNAVSLPQNYVSIAGFHIEENVKALPQDLQSVMDNAKHGVIFFSMGSTLQGKSMPTKLKQDLLKMFSQLKQTVIWKLEESTENLPKNVHLVTFAPQQSILAHPNCVLFITHGGLLSNIEALHFGVPIIGIPVCTDQFLNVDNAVQKGYAKRLHLNYDLPTNLKEAIEDILKNPSYRLRVQELSWVYHARAVTPAHELLHWVDHVVRTRGAPHLRNPALLLAWYQRMYLDLLALVLLIIGIVYSLLKYIFSRNKFDIEKKKN